MFESWPFTNFHDLNLDWIVKTVKRLDKDVNEWKIGLKEYVLELLSDHPEWIQDWMLDPDIVAENARNIAVASLTVDSSAWIHSYPVNRLDGTRRVNYNNSVAFDGTYYYEGFSPNDSVTSNATIFKMSAQGLVVDSVELSAGHAGTLFYKDGYLYAGDSVNTIYKIDTSTMAIAEQFNVSAIIPQGNWRGIEVTDDNVILATTAAIYYMDTNMASLEKTVNMPTNPRTEKQAVAINNDFLFIADNYPNTISVYKIMDSGCLYLKQFDIPERINDTKVGEIEGLQAIVTDAGTVQMFMSSVAIVCGLYVNNVFAFNAAPSLVPFNYTESYNGSQPRYYIDGNYTGPSAGTQSMPFKSLSEAFAHGSPDYETWYVIIDANNVVDKPASVVNPPIGKYRLDYSDNTTIYPNDKFQFLGCELRIYAKGTGWMEIALWDCRVFLATYDKSDALTAIVASNRNSLINVQGDLYWSYGTCGLTCVTGTVARTASSGSALVTVANAFTARNAGVCIKGGAQLGF